MQYSPTSDLSVPPDHRFYQKWAPLTDPADTRSGIKGYVKASLSVLMKGDAMSMASLLPTSTSGASEDIEKSVIMRHTYHNVQLYQASSSFCSHQISHKQNLQKN